MRVMMKAAAMMLATTVLAQPAFAQKAAKPAPAPAAQAQSQSDNICQAKLTPKVVPFIQAAIKAGGAKDWTAMDSALASASGLAKTSDDKCLIARFQLMRASNTNDMKGALAAVQTAAANGLPVATAVEQYAAVGMESYKRADYATASAAFSGALRLDPASDSAIWLAETRVKQGNVNEALSQLKSAIAARAAKGAVPADWYGRAVDVAFTAKSPMAQDFARQWVTAYPTSANWRNALVVATGLLPVDDRMALDLYRLDRKVGSLSAKDNLGAYADILQLSGFSAEADMVLKEAFDAGKVTSNVAAFKEVQAVAKKKMVGDRASLDGTAKMALTKKDPKIALQVSEAYLGYNEFAKSADLARAALALPGVNADRANLRLGVALALAGDKAGATTALTAVGGTYGEIAKYWLAHLASVK